MFEKFETNFSLAVSAIGLAILMALVVARAANSEPHRVFIEPATVITAI